MRTHLTSQGYNEGQIAYLLSQPQAFIDLLTDEHSPFAESFVRQLEAGFQVGLLLGVQSTIRQQASTFYEGPSLEGALGFTLLYNKNSVLKPNSEKGFQFGQRITAETAKRAAPEDIMPDIDKAIANLRF